MDVALLDNAGAIILNNHYLQSMPHLKVPLIPTKA